MAANVESMFYTRKAPWHGLGVRVEEAPESKEALIQAGLDWKVEQTDVYAASGERILGYKANIRDIDRSVLGIVGDRYKIVQNEEAFAFTDGLLGEGVKYETAGSLAGGKIVWMLAKIPEKYIISGDAIEPYLVFCNSHDGSGAIRVAMTPVRVVCQNTLNLALKGASRVWSARHTENVMSRMDEARETLQLANAYMSQLGRSINELQAKKLTDKKVLAMIDSLYPVSEDLSEMHLYPCAYSMTFNVTQKAGEDRLTLNAILNQRSQDVLAANNWNVVQYAVLVHMLAQVCDMNVGELVHVIADAHIYDRHVDAIKELISREPFPAPKFWLNPEIKDFYQFTPDDVKLEGYQTGEQIRDIPIAI